MKSKRKRLIDRLDELFSIYIRTRDKRRYGQCPFHLGSRKEIECCFHIITRSRHAVRWDTMNAFGACMGCNLRYEHDTVFITYVHDWYKRTFGEPAWDDLIRRGNQISKFSIQDLEDKGADLKQKTENVLLEPK